VLVSRVKKWLDSKRVPAVATAIACLLSSPSLAAGLRLDDLMHRAKLSGGASWYPAPLGWWNLFELAQGTPAEHAFLVERGFGPWWITPGLRLSFFRPVSSLTHLLDYALWPKTPALMHAQSILWYVALLAVVTVAFRRWLPPRAANVAVLFYAIDPTHGIPIGWIANRNAIIAATFAFGALLLWDSGKRWASSLLLLLALGAGESAAGVLGFFVAHWLFLRRPPLRECLPIALATALWAVVYRAGHHGVTGSGAYADPMHAPAQYAVAVLTQVPLLLGVEVGAAPPDLYPFAPWAGKIALIAIAIAFVGWTLRLVPRTSTTKFLAAGALLAVLPSAATLPSGRLLLIAGFGLLGVVATICAGDGARAYKGWAWAMHVVLAPLLFLPNLDDMVLIDGVLRRYGAGIPTDGSAIDKRVVLVNAPDTSFPYYMIVDAMEDGLAPPQKLLVASGNQRDVKLTRVGPQAFTVREDGGFYRGGVEVLFRDPSVPMHEGETIEQSDTRITVVHVLPDGVPDEAKIELARPLDGYVFRAWRGRALVPFELPPVGESITFPGRTVDLL
jgi:hypothetical protein